MTSVARRLLLGTGLGTAVVLIAAGATLVMVMRVSLIREFDDALLHKAAALAGTVEQERGYLELGFTEAAMEEFRRSERPEYYEVRHHRGDVVGRSPSLGAGQLPAATSQDVSPTFRALALPDGRPGRMVLLSFDARLDDGAAAGERPHRLTLALARDVLSLQARLGEFKLVLLGVGAAAMLVALATLAWLVRVGLRPVHTVAGQIARIDERRLSEPLDPSAVPRELRPIVARLNELLSRLDAAFAREKSLTANVAHELRTPLAGLRSTLEVGLSRERAPQEYRDAMSDCLTICRRTQAMVENLLALAWLDAGHSALALKRTDVTRLMGECWSAFEVVADRRGLQITWDVPDKLDLTTDAERLRLVLNNLFENAVNHADSRGHVQIRGTSANGDLNITISNSGRGIAPEDVAKVFDRFWRGDRARQQDGGHCGLGLPLCRTTVELLGGSIQASARNGSFVVTLQLPRPAVGPTPAE